jgi:pantoate--beta-alanine ligase
MEIYDSSRELKQVIAGWQARDEIVAFVPTMGNLHQGHIALVDVARERADKIVVSIFVNPLQFGPQEDYLSYPRTSEDDQALLVEAGVDALFMPTVDEIYPYGDQVATFVEVPEMSGILCGASRPGHFRGVATVVAKLFNLVRPDIAIFGAKDYQQLLVIRHMTADLCFPIEIVACPTGREDDGLAMSSRNRYLSEAEREIAPQLYLSLQRAVAHIKDGSRKFDKVQSQEVEQLAHADFRPEYFEVRDAHTLARPDAGCTEFVILAAAWLGRARLIDNIRVST